jgi:hypothetical protein
MDNQRVCTKHGKLESMQFIHQFSSVSPWQSSSKDISRKGRTTANTGPIVIPLGERDKETHLSMTRLAEKEKC